MPKGIPRGQTTRKAHLPRRDDLPFLKVSAVRKAGIINSTMTQAEIEVGGLKRTVRLWHMHFPNGGSWSFFICPNCGRKCQTLRLYDGHLVCRQCDGLVAKAQSGELPGTRHDGDKTPHIEQLRARLATRTKHYGPRKTEIALRKALIAQRRKRLEGWPPK